MEYQAIINEDEIIIEHICEKLNDLVNTIVHIDCNFVYIGSIEKGYYSIYNENAQGKNISLSLNFRLYYPDKNRSSIYQKKSKHLKNKNQKKDIEYEANNKLLYAKIEWFSVNPTGKGIGSKIIYYFVDLLKSIDCIEFILLSPKNHEAKGFWTKNKFVDEDFSISLDKRVYTSACKRLIYKYF